MQKNQTFSSALDALKAGHPISREGWNGKNMCVYMALGSHNFIEDEPVPDLIEGIKSSLFERGFTGTTTRLPNINMHTATGSTVTGWLASQTDMFAEDWCIHDKN